MGEGEPNFLSRWSRRKVQQRQGGEPAVPASPPLVQPDPAAPSPGSSPDMLAKLQPDLADVSVPAPPLAQAPPAVPRLTLDDAQALTPESDFSRFVARDVDPEVKNLAMKKLFADPHYNVMDGLDTYIDDYNTPDPIPAAMFKQLVQARMLGLLDDELEDQLDSAGPGAEAAPAAAGVEAAAEALSESASLAEPAVPTVQAPAEAGAAQEDPAGGGRAWESNPPGTA